MIQISEMTLLSSRTASFLLDGVLYSCICDGSKIVHSCNGGNQDLDSIAKNCLENAPRFHAWYFETSRGRTYGFLWEDELLFFAIGDSSTGSRSLLRFLQQMRERFKNGEKTDSQEELSPINRRQKSSMENVSRQEIERKKMEEREVEVAEEEDAPDREGRSAMSLQNSLSLWRSQNREIARRSWYRMVRMVVIIDLLVCFILLAIWLAICRGFTCVFS